MLLEGPAIEPLLAQVRDEYGSSVRIISADKVRTGGFGGFFAKQHYELSVEVPDADERPAPAARPAAGPGLGARPAPKPPAADDGPQTLEQLLARAESRDHIAPDDAADRATGRGAGLDDTAAAVTGRPAGLGGPGPGAGPERGLADPQSAFAELMANLDRAEANIGPALRAQAPPEDDEPKVRPFRPAQATGAPVNGGSNGKAKPLPPVPSLAELMGGLGVDESAAPPPPAAARAAQNPAPPRSPAAAYGLAPTSPAPAASLVEQLGGLGLDRPAPPTPAGPLVTTPMPHPPMPGMPHQWDQVQQNLLRVGMPEELAAQITGGDTYAGVLSVLAAKPSAPAVPDAPGEILVLAGDLDHALPIGRKLCEQAGMDQSHLLLGGPSAAGTGLHSSRILGDPEAAKAKAEKLQNADHAWIVLVDATVGRTDPIKIEDMCAALGATALWAVVDATRKTADTARHLRTLGDVEALVVHNVDITSDPATVLGLDYPIVSLDGKPASPHSWAAMLCARIAADVAPMPALPRRPRRG
ncbi:hypothetical protein [Symbioplanes lichenis]|uniref:hypothetical protein n=1 Tax=Symbioplanes lichenis TaxID=1629072 RepID=UPI002739296C|nr:hypothetical protein [Actinoplanes lichenis]